MLRFVAFLFVMLPGFALAHGAPLHLNVIGMHCAFCAQKVEANLREVEGVADVAVDVEKGDVVVTPTDNATLDTHALTQAVEDAGYEVVY